MRTLHWHNITALFGGSFDPPHLSHQKAVQGLLNNLGLKKIWITPSGNPPQKNPRTSSAHRFKMTQLTFDQFIRNGNCELLDIEIKNEKKGPQYSYYTIEELKKTTPHLAFILGSDQLNQFHTWHRFPEILKLCHWIILKRKGCSSSEKTLFKSIETLKSENFISEFNSTTFEVKKSDTLLKIFETEAPALSSRFIREQIALHGLTENMNEYLAPEVIEYLKSEHLYGI